MHWKCYKWKRVGRASRKRMKCRCERSTSSQLHVAFRCRYIECGREFSYGWECDLTAAMCGVDFDRGICGG